MLLVVVQASSPCLLASLASLALLPLPLLAEPDADPAPDIGQLQQNGKIVNFTDSCLGKRQHCSTQVQMTRRTQTSPAWSTFRARHPARMDLGASPRCSSRLLQFLHVLFFWILSSLLGCSGEICRPHGARPSEGVLAPERHPVSRYLYH